MRGGMDSTNDSLLRNARFLRLWIGQGTSFVGDAVSMVALVVLVVQITGSASAVGGALVARLLPTIASPLAGVLADRIDRRAVLVASDLARALLVLGLVFARDLATIYVLVFLMGLARTVFNPTVRAAFPSVVGGGDLTRANALISGTFSTSIMVGPALGGLLVASVGVDAAFLADAVTYLISAFLLSTVPLLRPRRESEEEGFVRALRSGFGYLIGTPIPLAIVLGSAMMAVFGDRINLVLLYFLSIFVGACALVGTGLAPAFVLALGALTVEGTATGIDNVATDTILQKRVPEVFLGRVFSIRFLGYSAGEALAYPLGGLLVDAVGPRSTYTFAGIATAAAGLLVLLAMIAVPTRGGGHADQEPHYSAEKRE